MSQENEYIIRNVRIIDGTGRDMYEGSVRIADGKFSFEKLNQDDVPVLDGKGLVMTPGFIDSHSHADLCLGLDETKTLIGKISQGVTTEVAGQCGFSLYPYKEEMREELRSCLGLFVDERIKAKLPQFATFAGFMQYATKEKKLFNYAFLVGHSVLRAAVMGHANRKPTAVELEEMKSLLKDAMKHGAKGLSSGLVYIPGNYADADELIALCKVIAPYGGVYATHMRNEADDVTGAVTEAIHVAREAGVELVISHHKICGKQNWGASEQTLALIHAAGAEGVQVHYDIYPYHATMTTLDNCLPPKLFAEGTEALLSHLQEAEFRKMVRESMQEVPPQYDNPYLNAGGFGGVLISAASRTKDAIGKTIEAYAKEKNADPFDTLFDLLIANKLEIQATYFSLQEEEMLKLYLDPHAVIGSDAICSEQMTQTHPRAFGSLIRPLAEFALKRGIIRLEDAVRKQTYETAKIWHLARKGAILEGYDADFVLLDIEKLEDTATFAHGASLAKGVEAVYIAGRLVYTPAGITQVRAGEVL